jgi:hypothetical protein
VFSVVLFSLPFYCLLTAACHWFWLRSWRFIGCFVSLFIVLLIFTSKLSELYICLFHGGFLFCSSELFSAVCSQEREWFLFARMLSWVTPGTYVQGNCMRNMRLIVHRMKLGFRPFYRQIRRHITI